MVTAMNRQPGPQAGLNPDIEPADPSTLHYDLHNPRMADLVFETEDQVIQHLIEQYDVEELVLSILTAGWLDYEPLIVEDGTETVIEGNRRLAALQLIRDEKLRERLGYTLPVIEEPHANSQPGTISIRRASNRQAAYVYIGFKHINGPFKWDALAKAKFAAEWIALGHELAVVSRTLGDSHHTVLRLVNGWNVLKRSIKDGFDPSDITVSPPFPISHLYTALPRPTVREYLGIAVRSNAVLREEDIPAEKSDNLMRLMSWLFGQRSKKEMSLIRTQNPDLNTLVRVLGHEAALEELVANRNLDSAAELLTPVDERFELLLRQAARACEDAFHASTGYNGNPVLLEVVNGIARTLVALREAMRSRQPDPLAAFDDAARKS
jgi:hypothetical protein